MFLQEASSDRRISEGYIKKFLHFPPRDRGPYAVLQTLTFSDPLLLLFNDFGLSTSSPPKRTNESERESERERERTRERERARKRETVSERGAEALSLSLWFLKRKLFVDNLFAT